MGLLDRFFNKKQLQLVEVVESTSLELMAHCVGQVRSIIRGNTFPTLGSNPDEFNKEAWNIFQELMALSLHLADRIAFNAVGPEKRSRFMDALLDSASSHLAQSILTDTSSEARQQFVEWYFRALYNDRTYLYAPLRLDDGEGPTKGTLFWEAAKVVADEHFHNDLLATLRLSINFGLCVEGVKDLSARLLAVHDL